MHNTNWFTFRFKCIGWSFINRFLRQQWATRNGSEYQKQTIKILSTLRTRMFLREHFFHFHIRILKLYAIDFLFVFYCVCSVHGWTFTSIFLNVYTTVLNNVHSPTSYRYNYGTFEKKKHIGYVIVILREYTSINSFRVYRFEWNVRVTEKRTS